MKLKSLISILVITVIYSCGSKKSALNQENLIDDIKSYITSVDANGTLTKKTTEGALTDAEGFKDIGTFKYTVYFDAGTEELFKIENVEKTNKNLTETYYFRNQKLVYLKSVSGTTAKKIVLNDDRVILEENTTPEDQTALIEKANRFSKMFNKSH